MLARARADTDDTAIGYARADLEHFAPGAVRFDLAYSSLALHYIENLAGLLAGLHAALAPGGNLVFSVEHPTVTAPRHPGWSADASGDPAWPVNHYLDEGPRSTNWLAEGVIKQHRTIASYLNLLLGAGFALARMVEWGPSAEQIAAYPDCAADRECPPFLLVACRR